MMMEPKGSREDAAPLPDPVLLAELRHQIQSARGVVVLTGAGVSAESGVPTFRDLDGIWRRFRPEELATPEAFRSNPVRVWEWYDLRRRAVIQCKPNPGHRAIARALIGRQDMTLVTQNVDGLHTRAVVDAGGAPDHPRVLELHGSLFRVRCDGCGQENPHSDPVEPAGTLPICTECGNLLRPAVVWFGEMLPEQTLETAFQRACEADICVIAGTSAVVHPAASVPLETLRSGGRLLEVNLEPTPLSPYAEWSLRGACGQLLPALLENQPTR